MNAAKARAPRVALAALAAIAVLLIVAQALGLGAAPDDPLGLRFGGHALIALAAVAIVAALGALVRATLARREDHYVEDVEDGDLP